MEICMDLWRRIFMFNGFKDQLNLACASKTLSLIMNCDDPIWHARVHDLHAHREGCSNHKEMIREFIRFKPKNKRYSPHMSGSILSASVANEKWIISCVDNVLMIINARSLTIVHKIVNVCQFWLFDNDNQIMTFGNGKIKLLDVVTANCLQTIDTTDSTIMIVGHGYFVSGEYSSRSSLWKKSNCGIVKIRDFVNTLLVHALSYEKVMVFFKKRCEIFKDGELIQTFKLNLRDGTSHIVVISSTSFISFSRNNVVTIHCFQNPHYIQPIHIKSQCKNIHATHWVQRSSHLLILSGKEIYVYKKSKCVKIINVLCCHVSMRELKNGNILVACGKGSMVLNHKTFNIVMKTDCMVFGLLPYNHIVTGNNLYSRMSNSYFSRLCVVG
jgi:hypothetical protein